MTRCFSAGCLLGLALAAAPPPANAQGVDERLLRAVYGSRSPVLAAVASAGDWTAYPVFAGATPATALASRLSMGRWELRPAYQMAAGQAAGLVGYYGLKRLIRRPRPPDALPGITPRNARATTDTRIDPYAFPSGHATQAFVVATSASLSARRWYVTAPAYAWAASIGLSRVWLGVHYPSDVLGGAVLGSGIAVAAHLLWPDEADGPEAEGVLLFQWGFRW